MYWKIEIIRDEEGAITSRNLLHKSSDRVGVRGKEVVILKDDPAITNPAVEVVDGELVLVEDTAKSLIDQETALYNTMVTDVYNQMEVVFGTKSDASAAAFASTYEAMMKRPNKYIGEFGLTTKEEVEAYAALKIEEGDDFAIYRMNRIAQFQAEKAVLLGA